jgi:hypothetical protein
MELVVFVAVGFGMLWVTADEEVFRLVSGGLWCIFCIGGEVGVGGRRVCVFWWWGLLMG